MLHRYPSSYRWVTLNETDFEAHRCRCDSSGLNKYSSGRVPELVQDPVPPASTRIWVSSLRRRYCSEEYDRVSKT